MGAWDTSVQFRNTGFLLGGTWETVILKNPEHIKVVKILEVEASLEEIEAGFGFISSNWPKWYFAFRPNPSTCLAITTCKINIGKVCPLPKADWPLSVVVSGAEVVSAGIYHLDKGNGSFSWFYTKLDGQAFIYRLP